VTSVDPWEFRRQDYSLDRDQQDVRHAFSEFFLKESSSSVVRAAEPLGYDARLWAALVDMGVTTMSLPATAGGDDATLVELVLIAEEVGRTAAPVPYVSHVVSTRLLAAVAAADEIIEAAKAGRPVALALAPLRGTGTVLVPDAAIAKDVIALDGDDLVLFRSSEPAPHVTNHGSTPLGRWSPAGAERVVLASGAAAHEHHDRAVAEWKLLMGAALIGLTQAGLDISVEFAKTRETMGVPIGSLQGVAFPLADVAIGISGGRNLIWRAAWMTEHEPGVRPDLIPIAFAIAAQVASHGTQISAHMQGGLGFMVEADASLFFLRSKGWSVLAGDPTLDLISVGTAAIALQRKAPLWTSP
jgi:alkylation response protein AidB-like acyl-CoA dehydrogenase